MAVYAIGDVQGCLDPLQRLLKQIEFNAAHDMLWFTGDLVNRGPDSLGVLRLVYGLGARAVVVLGNHDLHLLALAAGVERKKQRDTLDDVLRAPDREPLLAWLRECPLLHHDAALGYTLIHAGLLPPWGLAQAQALAHEAETALRTEPDGFFRHMYGNQPNRWNDKLRGPERLRVIVNAFTRLRYCDMNGAMNLEEKGALGSQSSGLVPWFQVRDRRSRDHCVVFGHWSALGRYRGDNVIALDSGCVWGRTLTAVRLDCDSLEFYEAPCRT
ncbi:MAG TPA: symmetrical bis(5'-nucleosyl)-tetraphosphatase [Burkholderiales bacterium]|nr:symmetrical bis(5'-nucleosyl)-tetraphosphatase [Burkholderiales bacterium]